MVRLPLSKKPSLASTLNDAAFHSRTVAHSRERPVARAASRTANAASVANPWPWCARNSSNAISGSASVAAPDGETAVADKSLSRLPLDCQ